MRGFRLSSRTWGYHHNFVEVGLLEQQPLPTPCRSELVIKYGGYPAYDLLESDESVEWEAVIYGEGEMETYV